jgi:TonB-linked SusC/RagA family outer membrane protein
MNVANILPGDTISVDLRYTEHLVPVNGTYEFVYPTVVGPRYSELPDDEEHNDEKWVQNPYQAEGQAPLYSFDFRMGLNTGVPLQKIFSPTHKVEIQYTSSGNASIRLDDSELHGGNRDLILRYRLRGGDVESGLLLNPRSDENFFLLMVEPPDAPKPEHIPAREYIFIVDISGSMQGFPLSVSIKLLRNLISSLKSTDRFNVMLFESSNSTIFKRSVAANSLNVAYASDVLRQLQGGGGTRLYNALQSALAIEKEEEFSRTFVVVTDGYVTVEKEAFNLIRRNRGEANLFAFGIGSSVNRFLIEGLAHAGMGEPFIVTNEKEADVVSRQFKEFIEKPVLTNIKIHYENVEVYDVEPVAVPDVFAERPVIIYGKYKGAPKGNIRISGYSGSRLWSRNFDLSSASSSGNNALRYLWARNKIKYLDDYAGYYESDQNGYDRSARVATHEKEITELGLKYNLLTQYTSFIAIDSLVRNSGRDSERVKQPLPLPMGVSNYAIGFAGKVAGITLSPDVQSLSELVVVGYGSTSRSACTGTVASIQSEEPDNATGISGLLTGRISGVAIMTNQGSPGAGHSIRIRGNNSIGVPNSPLIVLDGVPLDDTSSPSGTSAVALAERLGDINANDIESIQILKSGVNAAIYGSRGANGVILITTRRPRASQRELRYTTSVHLDLVNKVPDLQRLYAQGSAENGVTEWHGAETKERFSWGPALSDLRFDGSEYDYDRNGRLTTAGTGSPAIAYNPYDLFRGAISHDHHLSVMRSSERSTVGLGAGYASSNGVVPGTRKEHVSGRFHFEKRMRRIAIGTQNYFGMQMSQFAQSGNSPSSVMFGLLTTPPSFDNGNSYSGRKGLNSSAWSLTDGSPRSYSPEVVDNPYWSLSRNKAADNNRRILPSLFVNYDLSRWLQLKSKVAGEFSKNELLSGFDKGSSFFTNGSFLQRAEEFHHINAEFAADMRKNVLNEKISINGVVGFNTGSSRRRIGRTEGTGLTKPGDFSESNAMFVTTYGRSFHQSNRRLSARTAVSYTQLLSVDLLTTREFTTTLRNPIHSESAGLSFNFNEVGFVRNLNLFSAARVFASTSSIQKEAPLFIDPNHRVLSVTTLDSRSVFPERVPFVSQALNAETTESAELGLETSFLNDRLGIAASWFRSKTRDAYVPLFHTEGAAMINGGRLHAKGLEITLTSTPISRGLQWNLGINFSRIRSQVVALPEGADHISLSGFDEAAAVLIAGQPYGALYGTKYLRNESGQKIIGDDGYPIVDPVKGVIGNPNPDWTAGIHNSLRFRSFSLEFLFDIRKGGDIWNGTKNTVNYFGTGAETAKRDVTGYVFEGVNANGEPNSIPVNFGSPSLVDNRWARYGIAGVGEDAIEDGSWLRLRNVKLTYAIPEGSLSSLRIKKASVSLVSTNLFLLTRYSGVDPDTNLTGNTNGRGLDYFNLPGTRSYGMILKVGL